MESFTNLLEKIAAHNKSLAICIYYGKNVPDLAQIKKTYFINHKAIKRIAYKAEKNIFMIHITDPKAIDKIKNEINETAIDAVYDFYLTGKNDKIIGRSWQMYDFKAELDMTAAILQFYEEIVLPVDISDALRQEILEELEQMGIRNNTEHTTIDWPKLFKNLQENYS